MNEGLTFCNEGGMFWFAVAASQQSRSQPACVPKSACVQKKRNSESFIVDSAKPFMPFLSFTSASAHTF